MHSRNPKPTGSDKPRRRCSKSRWPRRAAGFQLWAIALGVLLGVNVLVAAVVLLRASPQRPRCRQAPPSAVRQNRRGVCRTARHGHGSRDRHVHSGQCRAERDGGAATTMTPEWWRRVRHRRWPRNRCSRAASRPCRRTTTLATTRRPSRPLRRMPRPPRAAPASCHHATKCWRRARSFPELRLDLHVYDPDPAKRFVFLNMRKLREGESLPDGVRVDAISQTGARLTYRGTQFRWTPTDAARTCHADDRAT